MTSRGVMPSNAWSTPSSVSSIQSTDIEIGVEFSDFEGVLPGTAGPSTKCPLDGAGKNLLLDAVGRREENQTRAVSKPLDTPWLQ